VRQKSSVRPPEIGELVEFRVSGSVITILPKLPSADDEYTPGAAPTY